jgi:hypothetical protein
METGPVVPPLLGGWRHGEITSRKSGFSHGVRERGGLPPFVKVIEVVHAGLGSGRAA